MFRKEKRAGNIRAGMYQEPYAVVLGDCDSGTQPTNQAGPRGEHLYHLQRKGKKEDKREGPD